MADENNNSPIMEFDDIGDAVRGHRPLHKARKYRVDGKHPPKAAAVVY